MYIFKIFQIISYKTKQKENKKKESNNYWLHEWKKKIAYKMIPMVKLIN